MSVSLAHSSRDKLAVQCAAFRHRGIGDQIKVRLTSLARVIGDEYAAFQLGCVPFSDLLGDKNPTRLPQIHPQFSIEHDTWTWLVPITTPPVCC